MPHARPALVVSAAVGLAACLALSSATPRLPARAPVAGSASAKVKLAVLVVFDQMRGDYLDKWRPLFGAGGFARLQADGAWFDRCLYPYATTTTGPGHASVLTGTCPDRHGIIDNGWFDAAEGAKVYCAGSPRYRLVPRGPSENASAVGGPDRLLSETLGDALKRATGGRAKVFGLSLKDRSAVLPVGKRPDGAFWFEGRFVTSTYYADRLPRWAESFNASGTAARYLGRPWNRSRPGLDYGRYSGPDAGPGEGKGSGQGTTFPHPIAGYAALANSPFGNDVLLSFLESCVSAEELGQRDVPDLLAVSFSSNDLIGHAWGPDSQEVLDATLRSDAQMAELLDFLDDRVGPGQYAVAVTADHGVCPLPEVAAAKGLDAKRVSPAFLLAAGAHLAEKFGKAAPGGDRPPAALDAATPPWLYLNPRFVAAAGRPRAAVARGLADYLARQPGVARAIVREELAGDLPESDEVGRLVKRSYFPARSGDVYVLLKPYHLMTVGIVGGTGTTHGTPYEYDRHVPLLVYGPGVPGGRRAEPVTPQAAAAVLAEFLGVPPPRDAEFPVPATLHEPPGE